ncbi:glycine betaine ABC transporter substrate-binding protein [Prosthecochloris sp. N3]|uniref:Glycine betaine ABC transporter substrate-binding protein n=1 Tax=Prosthecochloris ethylica TaxID=2743976 RepID=A0ABR9XT16_9CHLB|nr:glycine betaine ABC transporter substrate-binding protein [Prosthecochloris ethylica]MBF0585943.1 glycine betaine ABC transporter substrate-binding protein [Prosthecochloris ethylica]MBF0637052.1 glycine betaine ABC transporter substrate-binding protein [Prosthecochloris ethylica]NUK47289.1 glycine betaine ABC transporter substrate-binding protein [Prosthecochloris ethylica]
MKHTTRTSPIMALLLAVVMLGSAAFTGCSGQQGQQQAAEGTAETAAPKTADLVYVNWAEGVAYTHLAKVALEDKMGYEVKITAADVGPAYTAVAQGNKDAFMETWLPVLHKDYLDKFKDDIVDLGHVYEGTQSGLVVPAYVTIDNISELNDVREKFDGKITGIDAGAGIMQTTENVIESYGLDYELVTSSGPAMTAALKNAVANEEWIVVTGWKPHWMFGRWDLKFLQQDADKELWKTGNIHIMGRKDLETAKPELAHFLKNMSLDDAELADLMLQVEESDKDVEEVAREWMNANPDVVDSWIPSAE